MTSESVRRGAFICQECYATSFDTEPEAVKHENAYGHSTVWSSAVGKAVQEFAEPESKRRLVTLTSSAPANSRDPRQFTLMIEDEETNTVMAFDMDEHQFCLLMSHHVVKLEVSS